MFSCAVLGASQEANQRKESAMYVFNCVRGCPMHFTSLADVGLRIRVFRENLARTSWANLTGNWMSTHRLGLLMGAPQRRGWIVEGGFVFGYLRPNSKKLLVVSVDAKQSQQSRIWQKPRCFLCLPHDSFKVMLIARKQIHAIPRWDASIPRVKVPWSICCNTYVIFEPDRSTVCVCVRVRVCFAICLYIHLKNPQDRLD